MKFIVTETLGCVYQVTLVCNPKLLYPNIHTIVNVEFDSQTDIAKCIGRFINLTAEDYVTILLQYNAKYYHERNTHLPRKKIFYFKKYKDANKAVNFLNEKYSVIINLLDSTV